MSSKTEFYTSKKWFALGEVHSPVVRSSSPESQQWDKQWESLRQTLHPVGMKQKLYHQRNNRTLIYEKKKTFVYYLNADSKDRNVSLNGACDQTEYNHNRVLYISFNMCKLLQLQLQLPSVSSKQTLKRAFSLPSFSFGRVCQPFQSNHFLAVCSTAKSQIFALLLDQCRYISLLWQRFSAQKQSACGD